MGRESSSWKMSMESTGEMSGKVSIGLEMVWQRGQRVLQMLRRSPNRCHGRRAPLWGSQRAWKPSNEENHGGMARQQVQFSRQSME